MRAKHKKKYIQNRILTEFSEKNLTFIYSDATIYKKIIHRIEYSANTSVL